MDAISPRKFGSWPQDDAARDMSATLARLREGVAILEAINTGELLAALPAKAADRARHETAISLLGLLERSLRDVLTDLKG